MTPEEISKLSNEKLNELIAQKSGWEKIFCIKGGKIFEWHNPDKRLTYLCPDYCNSWQWAGKLLEEILKKDKVVEIIYRDFLSTGFVLSGYIDDDGNVFDTPTRAISEAWYLMECEK
jgi:hypothetical protein